jgi:hypothetical protein
MLSPTLDTTEWDDSKGAGYTNGFLIGMRRQARSERDPPIVSTPFPILHNLS